MSGPKITDPDRDESRSLPSLPLDAEQLIASSEEGLETSRVTRLGRLFLALGSRVWPALALVACVTSLAMAATALGLTLSAEGADGGSPEAAPPREEVEAVPAPPVLLGRYGSDVINCVSDTVTLFLPGDPAPSGAAAAWLEKADESLLVVMEAAVGGYRAQLDVYHGAVRVRGAGNSEKLMVRPGNVLIFRLDGLLGARVIEVRGETGSLERLESETCGQRAQTFPR